MCIIVKSVGAAETRVTLKESVNEIKVLQT